jgi:N-methylhydantoinase B
VTIFQRRLKSLTHEMSRTLYRSTRSPLFNNGDFATGFLDAAGNMLEQAEHLPLMAFSLFPGCQYLVDFFGDDIHDGDVFIHNDVWCRNLQHADVGFYKPIFADDQLIAWAACRGHWADIGGAVRGGVNPAATEVYQEALRIPPVKLWDRGVLRKDVWELIFANIRLRDMVEADARAQLGTCTVGERRLKELIAREGADRFRTDVERLYDVTERMVRAEIARIPDGTYRGAAQIIHDEPTGTTTSTIRVAVTVGGDAITFNFEGTDPQANNFFNASYTSAASATLVGMLYLLNPAVIHNHGMLRSVRIQIPEGTLLNARFPAATFMGNKLCHPVCEAIMSALGEVLPERVTAAWGRRLSYRVSGTDPRTGHSFSDIFFLTYEGGGATQGLDGYNQPGLMGGGNVLSQDYEAFEVQNALRLLEHEYVVDSAGPGRWRGGLGTRTIVEYFGEGVSASVTGEGTLHGASGAFGGGEGTLSSIEFLHADGTVERPHALQVVPSIASGTRSTHYGGGGGGYGPALERDPYAVVDDLHNGFISAEAAIDVYGVITDPDGCANIEATRAQRARMTAR